MRPQNSFKHKKFSQALLRSYSKFVQTLDRTSLNVVCLQRGCVNESFTRVIHNDAFQRVDGVCSG
jgi:hypothetical protein